MHPPCDCASSRREAALCEYHFDLMAEFSETGQFVWVNPGYSRILGYESHELVGRNGWDNVHPDDRGHVPSLDSLRAGRTAPHLVRLRHRDGSWRCFEGVTVEYRNSEGELRRIGIARDITEQQRVERQLRQSEERYRRLAEEGGALVSEVDGKGIILYANPRHQAVLGYPPESLLGQCGWDVMLPEDLHTIQRTFCEALETGNSGYLRFRALHADGTIRWMDGSVVRHDCEDGEPRLVCVSHDVTREKVLQDEREQLEIQVRQIEKLESLGVLAGGIAHDFNNLLVSVLGHAELALEDLELDSTARTSIQQVIAAAERASTLAQQMLALPGRTTLNRARINLSEVVAETLDLLRGGIPAHIEVESPRAETPASVFGDRSQLAQVVLNLMTNAIEALGPRQGAIRIQTGVVEDGRSYRPHGRTSGRIEEGRHAFLRVADDGPGMDPSIVERIFEPFFTTKFAGRGLGLASVLGIVRAHGGRIDLATEVHGGTEFTVLLPSIPGWRGSPMSRGG